MQHSTHHRWRAGGLAAFAAAAAIGLAACGGSSPPQVASLPASNADASTTATVRVTSSAAGSSATASGKGNPTALVDEWASCMRGHGDPNQADPTIDAHGVINVTIPASAQSLSNEVHAGADPCNHYMAAAQSALRAANPVAPPPDQSEQVKYVNCMRANGVPKYPYPTGNKTNFNGTGVDPNSPFVENANKVCGNKLGLPAWWINGTGPPGDVVVSSGWGGGPQPDGAAPNRPRSGTGGNGGAGARPATPGG